MHQKTIPDPQECDVIYERALFSVSVAFQMFEHHELSKETFVREQKLVQTLKTIREKLKMKKKQVKKENYI